MSANAQYTRAVIDIGAAAYPRARWNVGMHFAAAQWVFGVLLIFISFMGGSANSTSGRCLST